MMKNHAPVVRLSCVRLAESAFFFADFSPKVAVLLLVNETLLCTRYVNKLYGYHSQYVNALHREVWGLGKICDMTKIYQTYGNWTLGMPYPHVCVMSLSTLLLTICYHHLATFLGHMEEAKTSIGHFYQWAHTLPQSYINNGHLHWSAMVIHTWHQIWRCFSGFHCSLVCG